MRATDRFSACFRESKVFDFALLDELFHGARGFFDWNIRIDAVLVEQIDDIGLEALQGSLRDLFNVFRAAIESGLLSGIGVDLESEFGGNYDLSAEGSQRFPNKFFVNVRAVDFCSIEECDAAFYSCPDERNSHGFLYCRTEAEAKSHTPQADARDFKTTLSKFTFLHDFSLEMNPIAITMLNCVTETSTRRKSAFTIQPSEHR